MSLWLHIVESTSYELMITHNYRPAKWSRLKWQWSGLSAVRTASDRLAGSHELIEINSKPIHSKPIHSKPIKAHSKPVHSKQFKAANRRIYQTVSNTRTDKNSRRESVPAEVDSKPSRFWSDWKRGAYLSLLLFPGRIEETLALPFFFLFHVVVFVVVLIVAIILLYVNHFDLFVDLQADRGGRD